MMFQECRRVLPTGGWELVSCDEALTGVFVARHSALLMFAISAYTRAHVTCSYNMSVNICAINKK